MGFIRIAVVSVIGAALCLAAPIAATAAPSSPSKPHPTTTTTTAPSKNAQAFAKLVIKAASVGHVSVKTAGGSAFKPAKDGQSLHVGDTVQTDATGQAEIDYADTAYTRLDVNTTFTIKKLTDSQGNRQVEGSLDVGRTYNRTAALTQSQTFTQDGGGATAAVAGTAFVVTCTSSTTCTFTAVIDNINLSGAGGQTKTLNPLDECVDSNGALCGTTTRLTPDELALIQWIQTNVYLDLVEHGIGTGVFQPFTQTVVVSGAAVTSAPTDGDLAIGAPPNITTVATSPSGAIVNYSAPSASDEGGESVAVSCNPPSGSTFSVGTTTVTCTATDADDTNGPVKTSFTVTVTDNDLTMSSAPPNQTVPATSPSGATVNYTPPTATDEGGQHPTVTCNPPSGSTFAVGTTTVTCTPAATDDTNGPVSRQFTVTVTNSDLAIATAPDVGPIISATPTTVNYTPPTATDEGGQHPTVTCNPPSGSTFAVGTTTVTCTATDVDDTPNSVSSTFTVTVSSSDLAIATRSNIGPVAGGSSGANVTFTAPAAVDDGDTPTVTCDHNSGDLFPVGTTTVICTARDTGSDDTPSSVSSSFTVTVNDVSSSATSATSATTPKLTPSTPTTTTTTTPSTTTTTTPTTTTTTPTTTTTTPTTTTTTPK